MKWDIVGGDTFPLVEMHLEPGESVKAEAGSMVSMTSGLTLTGKIDGGIGRAIGRLFTGESFFMQHITADKGAGTVHLATPVPGGVIPLELTAGQDMLVQKNGFLAATEHVDVSTKAQNLVKGFLSGEGFFIVKLSGEGTAFISSYGSIYALDIPEDDTVLVDNGHLVAWSADMKYKITKGAKSWFSSVTSGEGFGCRFHGPGRVYVQTRNPHGLGNWIMPFIPFPRSNNS